jgi:release factor glutamine methyltransferase
MTSYKPQTIAQVLARGIVALATRSESPRTDAQMLLAHVLQREREWIVAHGEAFLSKTQGEKFVTLCEVRAEGTPMAYILGFAGFYGREFAVNDKVLVPRPETEHLVEEAVRHLRARVDPQLPKKFLTALDVGVGSGAIACTLAAEIPNLFVEGTDISAGALKMAEYNARRLNVIARCKFYYGDLASSIGERHFDLVIANLPYIPSDQLPKRPEAASFEPKDALDGGHDGLDHYRRFLPQARKLLKPGGMLLLEAAPTVMDGLVVLVNEAFRGSEFGLGEDYGGRLRYVKVQAPVK